MPLNQERKQRLSGSCPVCEAPVVPQDRVEESEILHCPECYSVLFVEGVEPDHLVLSEAPQIEEDWGE